MRTRFGICKCSMHCIPDKPDSLRRLTLSSSCSRRCATESRRCPIADNSVKSRAERGSGSRAMLGFSPGVARRVVSWRHHSFVGAHRPTLPCCLCGSLARLRLLSTEAPRETERESRPAFSKLAGRAPKGKTRKRQPRPAAGKVSAVELRALGKELGWDDEMIKNPDLLDILLVESARRQEDAARMKDTALYTALAERLQTEFRVIKNLWNDTGGYGNKLSQFKPASAVRGPPPKSAKTLGAVAPQEGEPITVDLGMEMVASPHSLEEQEHGAGGGDTSSR